MEDEQEGQKRLLNEIERLRAQIAARRALQAQRKVCETKRRAAAAGRPSQTAPQDVSAANEGDLLEVANHIREVVWIFDWQRRKVVYVSPAYEDVWGRPRRDIDEDCDRWYDTLHPDDRESVRASLATIVESDRQQQRQYRVVRPDGSIRWVSDRACAVRDENGTISRIVGVAEDITERQQVEETLENISDELEALVAQRIAEPEGVNTRLEEEIEHSRQVETELRKSEEKYRTLVESAGETIAVIDAEGVFLFMNKTAAMRLGGTPEDFTGKSMWDLFPKTTADRQAQSVRKTIRTGEGVNAVVLVELPGQQRWYNTTVEPIRDASGKPQSALVIARDIHDLRQAQQQLEQYQQHMSRAEHLASVGTLSATVAHELTQPLTVIRLSLQSALAQLNDANCPQAALEALHDSLDGVSDVVSRIERFRNYARQSTQTNPSHVRLQDIVERTLRLLEGKARASRVSLATAGLDALPLTYADPKDLEQMCFALIENAIQASDGQTDRRLTVRGRVNNQQIVLSFEDTCGGIPAESLDKIFQPFFTTKGLGEGTGLGLCIVETTVSRLGGKVHVETTAGEGSTFRITLPVVKS